jgi:hypothetical protein
LIIYHTIIDLPGCRIEIATYGAGFWKTPLSNI